MNTRRAWEETIIFRLIYAVRGIKQLASEQAEEDHQPFH